MPNFKQKRSNLFFILVITLVILITFYRSWDNYFNSDAFTLLNYAKIAEDDPFKIIWSDNIGITFFRPVDYAYNFLVYKLVDANPTGNNIIAQLFHLFNSILVFYIALKITKNNQLVAFVSSLFFAVNSTHSDAVLWLGGSPTLLVTFFILTAFYSFILFIERGNRLFYALSVILFITALLSKTSGLMLLPLIILYEFFISKGYKFGDIKRIRFTFFRKYAPFLAITIAFLVSNYYIYQSTFMIRQGEYGFGFHVIKNIAVYIAAMMIGLPHFNFIFASNSMFMESFAYLSFMLPILKIVAYISIFLVPILTIALLIRKDNTIRFCVFWVYITLSDVSPFVYKPTSRYTYLPSVGFLVLLSYLLFLAYGRIEKSDLRRYSKILIVSVVLIITMSYIVLTNINEAVFHKEGEKSREFLELLQTKYPHFPEHSTIYVINSPIYGLAVDQALRFFYDDQSLNAYEIKKRDLPIVKIDENTYIIEYKSGELITPS